MGGSGEGTALLLVMGVGLGGILVYMLTRQGGLEGLLGGLPGASPQAPDDTAPAPSSVDAGPSDTSIPSQMPMTQLPTAVPLPGMSVMSLPGASKVIQLVNIEAERKGLSKAQLEDIQDALEDHLDDLKTISVIGVRDDDDRHARTLALTILNELQNPLQVKIRRDRRHKKLTYTVSSPRGWKTQVIKKRSRLGWSDEYY